MPSFKEVDDPTARFFSSEYTIAWWRKLEKYYTDQGLKEKAAEYKMMAERDTKTMSDLYEGLISNDDLDLPSPIKVRTGDKDG